MKIMPVFMKSLAGTRTQVLLLRKAAGLLCSALRVHRHCGHHVNVVSHRGNESRNSISVGLRATCSGRILFIMEF